MGEPALQTLKREMLEELNSDIEILRLLWLAENFFEYDSKECHELGLYFLMQFPDEFEKTQQREKQEETGLLQFRKSLV